MKLNQDPKTPKRKSSQLEKRHVIVEASQDDTQKLDAFMNVMQTVAEDMGLKAYLDTNHYLIGSDY